MTAMTMSSLMPSVSTFLTLFTSPGDGGGVCAAGLRTGLGAGKSATGEARGEGSGDGDVCSRLTLLDGCVSGEGLEGVDLEFER